MVGLTHNERCLIYNLRCGPQTAQIETPWIMLFYGAVQQQVYHNRKFTTVVQLKQAIVEEWNKLLQRFIDCSMDEWHRRLTNCCTYSRVDTLSTLILNCLNN